MIRYVLIYGLLGLIIVALAMPIVGQLVSEEGKQMRFISAYPLTQRLTAVINLVSASPENESAVIKINPLDCTINFYDNNYVESTVKNQGQETSYGLFIFPINLNINSNNPPSQIECDPENEKILTIVKINGVVNVIEGEYEW